MNVKNKNAIKANYNNIVNLFSDDTTKILCEINDVSDFIDFVYKNSNDSLRGQLYRGQRISSWKITSSLTRAIYPPKKQFERIKSKIGMDEFKNLHIYKTLNEKIEERKENIFIGYANFVNYLPSFISEVQNKEYLFNSELSQLLLAQHYGYPTRFIDWTLNPLIALYFAVENSKPEDDCLKKNNNEKPAVFVYNPERNLSGMEFDHATDALYKQTINNDSLYRDFSEKAKEKSFKLRFLSMLSILSAESSARKIELEKIDTKSFELPSEIQNKLKVNQYVIYNILSLDSELINSEEMVDTLFENILDFSKDEQKSIRKKAKHIIKIMKLSRQEKYAPITLTHYEFDKRMSNQESVFTIQDNIDEPFSPKEPERLNKVVIVKPYLIKAQLIKLGITESKIYPSLSGLLNTLKFKHINENYKFID
ncbi:FRG domain-containing protein [Providencia rettgeri]|uniref:FRG domain-containing protein n=1 Tax=Providencia rettgeri TaxID=587 RepID=UPI001BA626F5|nr:FRG domain-containing protein [Providencia rettgeri]MBS0914423.1 FRG domain-containing protein [Providencia rettgeri]